MARINFEKSIYLNPNFSRLLLATGCILKTKGMLVHAWELAHEHWLEFKSVPADKWLPEMDVLLETGFARRLDNGNIYVCGSEKHCKYLEERQAAGRKGGEKKAEKHKNKQTIAKHSKSKQSLANLPSVSISVSDSKYISNTTYSSDVLRTNAEEPLNTLPKKTENKWNPVSDWASEYKKKYGVSYEVTKKDAGILFSFSKGKSQERVRTLFCCYLAIKDDLYEKQKHPLSLFFRDLSKISHAAQTGIDPSKKKKIILED